MAVHAGGLRASTGALSHAYDVALLDLDGVVYIGANAVPNAAAVLAQARADGMRLAFVTNNAARPPDAVAQHLSDLGIPAAASDVINSAQAAAHYLADRLPTGARVLVVGTTGLIEALLERGLQPVTSADDEPVAVVQGYSPTTNWQMLAEGAVAIRRGAFWVATNLDATVPSARGPLPGNGSLVAALAHATGATPISTGKPDPTMHRESVERSGARRPLVVGDRLDTDIEGAAAVGCHSLLVLSGVTTPADLVQAAPNHRPDFIARDVGGLLIAHHAPVQTDDGYLGIGWHVDRRLVLTRTEENPIAAAPGDAGDRDGHQDRHRDGAHRADAHAGPVVSSDAVDDDLDALRTISVAAWAAIDRNVEPKIGSGDRSSAAVLARLSLQ